MYEDVMRVIEAGGYDLADLLRRIDVLYVGGRLTDDGREALVREARDRADADASKGTEAERIARLEAEVLAISDRVAALEAGGGEVPEPEAAEYDPQRWYRQGERCMWQGKVYEWNADGSLGDTLGVWSPADYPQGWTLVGDAPQG